MNAILRTLVFSALLVLVILAGMRLGRAGEPVPPPLAALRDAELAPLGRAGVLDGWLVRKPDGSVLTLYAAPDGHVVAGLLYGPDGLELTGRQLEQTPQASELADVVGTIGTISTAASTAADDRAALFARSLEAAAFTVGSAGPDLVAFIDPGCPWSRQAAAVLGQLALDGRFRLHALPVGVMSPESHAQAARILASPRPGLAWYRSSPATAEDIPRLEANNALWRAFGADAVPWLAWRGRDGAIHTHAGLPADFMKREDRAPREADGKNAMERRGMETLLMDLGREGIR